jgi:hypothetical protein
MSGSKTKYPLIRNTPLRSKGTKNNAKLESIAMTDFQKRSSRSTVQLLRWLQATSDIAVNEKSSISDYILITI